jgi:hypothetical protein
MHCSSGGASHSEPQQTLVAKLVANPKSASHFRTKMDLVSNYAMSFQPLCGYSVSNTSNKGPSTVTRVRRHVQDGVCCFLFLQRAYYAQQHDVDPFQWRYGHITGRLRLVAVYGGRIITKPVLFLHGIFIECARWSS